MPFRRRYAVAAFSALVLASAGTYAYAAQPTSKPEQFAQLPRPTRSMSEKSRSFDQHSVLVKFKSGASATAKNKALSKHGAHNLGSVGGSAFQKAHTDGSAEEVVKALRKDPAVQAVSLDYKRHASATPNDPRYAAYQKAYLDTVRVPQAWDLTKGSTAQIIAVVDTGVNVNHEDLIGRTAAGYNVLNTKALPNDDNGHGTMVAGIAAGNTNNAKGDAGVAWTGRVMPVKVLDRYGDGYDSDIATGVRWAADKGAKIINLSLGGPGGSPVLHDAVTYATGKGAVVVVAAGNDGDATPQYPAAYPEVLSVGATDASGYLTDFSSHGDWVDLAAPGFGIWGPAYNANTGYRKGDGTSFSAPIVSGIAALVRSRNPGWSATSVISKIESTARDAGPRGIDPYYGHGVVDAYAAVGGTWGPEFPQRALDGNEPNGVPDRATVLPGSITGTISAEGDVDWYKYDSTTNQPLRFTVTPAAYNAGLPQNFDPIITVYDKDLKKIGTIDDTAPGTAETLSFQAGVGLYYIAVTSFNGAADTRPYTLSADTTPTPGTFAPYQATSVGSWAEAVTVGDVTGDGRSDVLMSTSTGYDSDAAHDYKLWVFAQQPDGTLAKPVSYSTALQINDTFGAGLALLDVDGDSHLDVALATQAGVQIFHQNGAGTLDNTGLLPGTTGAFQVVAADMDGDSDTDLVTNSSSGVKLLTHQPGGTFTVSTGTTDAADAVKVGDVDGNGRPDVVTVLGATESVYKLSGTVWSKSTYPTGSTTSAWAVEAADVNGDGKSDVVASVTGKAPNAKVSLRTQNATGGLNNPVLIDVRDYPESIGAADIINDDSRLDLVVTHGGHNAMSLIPQTSAGGLGTPEIVPLPFAADYNPQALAFADINGDGKVDAVVADYPNGLVTLVKGAPVPGVQPWVRDVSTPDSAKDVPLDVTPTVTFARPIDAASVTAGTVKLVNGATGKDVPATPAYDSGSNSVTITPSAALQDNTPYRIVVSGLTDTTGTTQAESYSSTFRTVDVAPPAVTGLKATGNGANTVTLSWTNPAITDTDVVVVRMAAGTTPPDSPTAGTLVFSANGSGVTKSGLTAGSSYAFSVWVRDRSGKYSPVQNAALTGTAVSITSNTTGPSYGTAVTVTGLVTRTDSKAGIAGVPVQLYGRRKGTTTWSLLGTATSSDIGAVSLNHTPSWSLDYQWIYRGSTDYVGSGSALRSVGVHTVVTGVVSPTAIRLGGSTAFSGLVKPWHGGKTVYLQRYSGGKWTNVTSQKLSSTSSYKFVIKPTARGTYTYRVYMPADTDHLYGYSPTRSFKVS